MHMSKPSKGALLLSEMKEFGTFDKKTQRYIRQSLDVAFERGDPLSLWGRNDVERENIRFQQHNYRLLLSRIRTRLTYSSGRVDMGHVEHIIGPLIAMATFDIQSGTLTSFAPFRFLYERLFGADIRAWLPAVYVAASALPVHPPDQRKIQLQAISEASCCAMAWSPSEPSFFPEWVDKVETDNLQLPRA